MFEELLDIAFKGLPVGTGAHDQLRSSSGLMFTVFDVHSDGHQEPLPDERLLGDSSYHSSSRVSMLLRLIAESGNDGVLLITRSAASGPIFRAPGVSYLFQAAAAWTRAESVTWKPKGWSKAGCCSISLRRGVMRSKHDGRRALCRHLGRFA